MRTSRRSFLQQLAAFGSLLLGATQLSGCREDDDSSQAATTSSATTQSASGGPTQQPLNSAPVWQPSPAIEFVEGVPATVSVRDFVLDPDKDPLVIALKSGALLPGITWHPNTYVIAYDGRPLGAKPDAPVVVSGIIFSADDQRN